MSAIHWFWLVVVQSVWASSYIAMKFAVAEMPVGGVLFLRYGFASLLFILGWAKLGWPRFTKKEFFILSLLGVFNFGLAPAMQVTSLKYTQAIDVSIVIALEPLITVLLASTFYS